MKRVLFIAPCFHGYEKLIIKELERKGYEVVFYPEREYSFMYKLTHHLSWRLLKIKQNKYYKKILEKLENNKFDILLVIRGFLMTPDIIEIFNKRNPNALKIMYQWDSNKTNNFSSLIPFFDKVFSFDYEDCNKLNLNYLPLFYTEDINNAQFNEKYSSDFFFMGTYLPERYKAIKLFDEKYSSKYIVNSYIYIPLSSKIKELFKGKYLNDSFIYTEPLDRERYLQMLKSTKVMVDVSNANQTGLAMRIIEALAMGKKVLTNNYRIKDEPFYDPSNICIMDEKDPEFTNKFLCEDQQGINTILSLSKWLNIILQS